MSCSSGTSCLEWYEDTRYLGQLMCFPRREALMARRSLIFTVTCQAVESSLISVSNSRKESSRASPKSQSLTLLASGETADSCTGPRKRIHLAPEPGILKHSLLRDGAEAGGAAGRCCGGSLGQLPRAQGARCSFLGTVVVKTGNPRPC